METIVWKRNDDYIILNRLVIIFLAMDKHIISIVPKAPELDPRFTFSETQTLSTSSSITFTNSPLALENDNRPLCPELFQDVRYGPFNTVLVSFSPNLLGLFLDSFHAVSTQMIFKLVISADCTYLDVCSVLELPVSIPYLLFVRCGLLFGDSHQQKTVVCCIQASI